MIRALASSLFLLAVLALGAAMPRVAQATPGTDGCTGILHLPQEGLERIEVTTPGTWCLDADLSAAQDDSTEAMIVIYADDVTIDCRGHRLEYTGTADSSYGVSTAYERQGIVVRNCRFRGFSSAVAVFVTDDFLIEDNVVESSRGDIFEEPTGAIYASGRGTIRRNRIHDSVLLAIGASGEYDEVRVLDNLVDGVVDTATDGDSKAIELANLASGEVRGNVIRGVRHDPAFGRTDPVRAVTVEASVNDGRDVRLSDNAVVQSAGTPLVAFACSLESLRTRFADNVLTGVAQATLGCTDAGENDVSP
jgi:hypothetical protein